MEHLDKNNGAEKTKNTFFMLIVSIFAVAFSASLIVDFAVSKNITWSRIPCVSLVLLTIIIAIIFYIKNNKIPLLATVTFLAIMILLFVIYSLVGTLGILKVGITITVALTIEFILLVFLLTKLKGKKLYITAIIFLFAAIAMFTVNIILEVLGLNTSVLSNLITFIGAIIPAIIFFIFGFIGHKKI